MVIAPGVKPVLSTNNVTFSDSPGLNSESGVDAFPDSPYLISTIYRDSSHLPINVSNLMNLTNDIEISPQNIQPCRNKQFARYRFVIGTGSWKSLPIFVVIPNTDSFRLKGKPASRNHCGRSCYFSCGSYKQRTIYISRTSGVEEKLCSGNLPGTCRGY